MNYEKERYVWKTVKNSNFSYACIYDSKDGRNLYTNELILNMLNQQDKHIKELENSNQKNQDYYWSEINKLDELYNKDLEERLEEVKQLKQSQKQLAINELLRLKSYFVEECLDGDDITTGDTIFTKDAVEIALQISNQIKELGR